ncbi:MAG: hypothetical protein HQK81_02455 [Desulfovibrionaceae bacterium]|nr:hypothetical protein [Desulfovibrionaceae bacterium]MBF0512907.1 hypothetical protein [Desulfovibrionaceae bacterium]
MSSVNWITIYQQAIDAVKTSLGSTWSTVATSAQHSIQLLVQTAQYITDHSAELNEDEQKLLTDNQQLAMQSVLLGYKAIGIAAAEQAVDAAWGVIQPVLEAAIKIA